jgi:hypothetical protein
MPKPPLWGITTYFNPGGYGSRLVNYRAFRESTRRQGLPLVTVELAFGDATFELGPEDADVLVQKRSGSVLWQKERLLNVALAHLPPECELVCWADADVLFEDSDWIAQATTALKHAPLIQPFRRAIRLPRGAAPADFPSRRLGWTIRRGTKVGTYVPAVCSRLVKRRPSFDGTTGYAWCARREVLAECGFYDRCVVGGGDREMALAAAYPPGAIPSDLIRIHHGRLRDDLAAFHEKLYPMVAGKVGHLPGTLHHLWHGDPTNRSYENRHAILEKHDFDPRADIALDADGCWAWSTNKAALVEAVTAYFDSRREDG